MGKAGDRREKPVVWFIARAFPPVSAIGADRATKWVRSLLENYDVVVFTIDGDERQDTQAAEIAKGVSLADVRRVPMFFSDEFHGREKKSSFQFARKIVYVALTAFFIDSGWTWVMPLRSSMRAAVAAMSPDLIVATGSPFLSFWVVSAIARKHAIPYILDYRDLWSENPQLSLHVPILSRIVARGVEIIVNKYAALLTSVSKGCKAVLSKDGETRVLYNLPDQLYVDAVQAVPSASPGYFAGCLTLFYGGALYIDTDLTAIARALSKLPSHRSEKIRFHYCGSSSKIALENFLEFGVQHLLVDHGALTKERAQSLMKRSNVCVSVVHNSSFSTDPAITGLMTTKIFDYLIAGKPVLNIAPKGSELVEWCAENGINNVTTFSSDETDAIATHLAERIEAHGDANELDLASQPQFECPLWEQQFEATIGTSIRQFVEKGAR